MRVNRTQGRRRETKKGDAKTKNRTNTKRLKRRKQTKQKRTVGGIKSIRAIAIIRADSQFKFHTETIERGHKRQKYTHLAGQQTKTKPKRPRGRWKSQHTTKSKTKGTREKTSELPTSPKRKELPRRSHHKE